MSGKPRVSIVIVNWNGRHHLVECLDALDRQTLDPLEIIVVDNGSDDGSPQVLENYPGVRLLALDRNVGFAAGNNRGIELAQGEYLVLLNNDTRPAPDWLERLVQAAEQPDVGIVASLLTTWDGKYIDTAGDRCTVSGRGLKQQHLQATEEAGPSREVFSACAGAALYKRSLFEDVGLFEEDFFMNAEDTDLAFRARLRGWKVYFCAEAIVHHRISASLGRHSDSAVFHSTRNHIWLYFRCMPGWLCAFYLPHLLVHTMTYGMYFVLHGQAVPFFRGLFTALPALSRVWSQRRMIQEGRRVDPFTISRALTPLLPALAEQFKRVA